MRLPGKNDPQAEARRAVTRDARRADRIAAGTATTVQISVTALREMLLVADDDTFRTFVGHLGAHTVSAVVRGEREITEFSA